MTSTNIFHGLTDEGRNSSRVLRPPGGGHTDVLGLSGDPQPQQQKKVNQRNFSSIIEGTNEVIPPLVRAEPKPSAPPQEPKPAPVTQVAEPAPVPIQVTPEPVQATPSPVEAAPAPVQAAPVPVQAPQRTRIPPGGFSSGLW